jgi:hypothetical protein
MIIVGFVALLGIPSCLEVSKFQEASGLSRLLVDRCEICRSMYE